MSRRATIAITALALAAAALAPAVALGGAHAAGTHSVILKSLRFHPGTVTINHGESVKWEWRDGGERHNVTFSHFHSHTMGSGSYTVRFNSKGTYNYRCTIHEAEGMRGKIIVR
jgi:plastocyanin